MSWYELLIRIEMNVCYFQGMKELRRLVDSLPPVNYNLLKYICRYTWITSQNVCYWTMRYWWYFFVSRFLDEVQSYSGVNKMSVQNLATVFGPNILRPKVEDPVAIMEGQYSHLLFTRILLSESLSSFNILCISFHQVLSWSSSSWPFWSAATMCYSLSVRTAPQPWSSSTTTTSNCHGDKPPQLPPPSPQCLRTQRTTTRRLSASASGKRPSLHRTASTWTTAAHRDQPVLAMGS